MSIKFKVATVLAALFGGLLLINAVVLLLTVSSSFQKLERLGAEKDMRRVVNALHFDMENLSILTFDWATWDDTYNFVISRDPSYVEANLTPVTFASTNMSLLYIVDAEGRTIWGKAFDQGNKEFITLADFPESGLDKWRPFLTHATTDSVITGLIMMERGPMLVSSRPILTSRKTGPIRGALIMGRFLDDQAAAALSARVHVPTDVVSLASGEVHDDNVRRTLALPPGKWLVADDDGDKNELSVYGVFHDIAGNPALLLHTRSPKDITAQGSMAIKSAMILMAITVVAAMAIIMYLLQNLIITPLSAMTRHVVRVGRTGTFTEKMLVGRRDELGLVARAFNRMQKRISLLAHYDHLTGLANRSLFVDRVKQIIKMARRENGMAALYFIDLDGFKGINDNYGHHAGDLLLKEIADRLVTGLRDCDTISRMGGDEFTIIAYGLKNREEATIIADKVIDLFNKPFDIEDNRLNITTSVGVSIFPDHGDDVDVLLKCADLALYRIKESGKNDYQFFDPLNVGQKDKSTDGHPGDAHV
ncbi:MAG: hypothetical protein A3G18_11510 [Rhodospirillales bacterium RIFCSPLOWO2_12_FULL_58_28]|nr:MAG: hypothetical protein A3H92_10655 [Rhodospirillales bacterium RIFCSPLOWO2_02_FULL_58_16]OHC77808.1 MAG: hypothetical protein A3G18_11510 [Rhodospirillales bacterium RIFCSPLOWO2_12_FULL_58_28]